MTEYITPDQARQKAEFINADNFINLPARDAQRTATHYLISTAPPLRVTLTHDTTLVEGDAPLVVHRLTSNVKLLMASKLGMNFVHPPVAQLGQAIAYGAPPARTMISAGATHGYAAYMNSHRRIELTENNAFSRRLIPAVYHLLPGFGRVYFDYVADPDDGVQFVMVELPAQGQQSFTEHEVCILLGIVTLALNKNWVSDVHYNQFFASRFKALQSAMRAEGVNMVTLSALATKQYVEAMSEALNFYPKLKTCIFSYYMHGESVHQSHVRALLRMSQLAVFNLINMFLDHTTRTMLHLDSKVIAERPAYLEARRELIRRYGPDYLDYAKIYEPTITTTNISGFRNLADAAWAFIMVNTEESRTLRKLRGRSRNIKSYMKKAATHVMERYLADPPAPILTAELLQALGFTPEFGGEREQFQFMEELYNEAVEALNEVNAPGNQVVQIPMGR